MTRRYNAFISYSWADKAWGEWLHRTLETYRAPKGVADGRSLHPIFKDREEEAAGGSVGAAIEAALEASEFLIVICSPRSANSTWVNREVAWFKTHKDKGRVLALIVDGEPGASATPGREGEECFPKTLTHKVGADLQPTEEWEDAPLAADARPEGDGKRGAKLKLAAALLGVGLDALVRRDERRRTVRRRFTMAALGSLAFVLGGLSLFAFNQRDAARFAQQDAEFQRDEAQSLVEFMLTDLRQSLDAVGRLDILDSVAKRLLESYERQDLQSLDADALGRRARVLLLLGEVEGTRGKLDNALARYREAAAATEELLRRDPDDQQRIFDHAQSVYWVGDIALKRGDMATVTDYWTQYRDFGARLVELNPDKDEWRTELAYGHRNLASLALDEGNLTAAEAGFRRALEISAELAAKHPNDKEMQIALAQDYHWLSSAEERLGNFADAEQSNAKEAAIYAALLERDADDDSILHRQSVNGRVRARIVMAYGDAARAREILLALIPLHEKRIARDPQNIRWLRYYGLLQIDVGAAQLTLGDAEAARLAADTALDMADRLLTLDPASVEWAIENRWRALLLATRCAQATGDWKGAETYIAQSEEIFAGLKEIKGALPARLLLGVSLLRARQMTALGVVTESRRLAKLGTDQFINGAAQIGFEHRTDLVEVMIMAGDIAGAAAMAKDLDAAGYRHPDFIRLKEQIATLEGRESASRSD